MDVKDMYIDKEVDVKISETQTVRGTISGLYKGCDGNVGVSVTYMAPTTTSFKVEQISEIVVTQ